MVYTMKILVIQSLKQQPFTLFYSLLCLEGGILGGLMFKMLFSMGCLMRRYICISH
jgi:hypothetical protein